MKKTKAIDHILGQNIIKQRVILGMSRKHLAQQIGITHQQMQKYENGINRITVSRLYDVASALKISMTQLIEVTDSSTENSIADNRAIADIMKYINKITDKTKLEAIKNLIRSISVAEVV